MLGEDGLRIMTQLVKKCKKMENVKMIKQFTSNTSHFIMCEATCFGPYVTIIWPSCESSQ